jgi:hypothetical protein
VRTTVYLIPAALFLAALAAARAVGFTMVIPWDFYQLLEGRALAAHPLGSLCYLHSQPPGLNGLLAAVLATAGALECPPHAVASVLFAGMGLLATLVLFRVIHLLTASATLATIGVLLVLADPGYALYSHLFFYEFILAGLLVFLLLAAMRYFEGREPSAPYTVVGLLCAITLTRTLFHPLWACACLLLVVALRRWLGRGISGAQAARALLVLAVVLSLWPLKNYVVYGQFVYGTLSFYSLSRTIPGCSRVWREHARTGALSAGTREIVARAERQCGAPAAEVLTAATKSDGSPNWNRVRLLTIGPDLARCGLSWRLRSPGEWMRRTAGQYCMWTRPTFIQPYGGFVIGPPDERYMRYARAYEQILFFDLRPYVEWLHPGFFLHRYAMVTGTPVPYTVFGFLLLPAVLIAALVQTLRERSARSAGMAVALFCLVTPMIGVCLTDGQEGNRMRFPTAPLFAVLVCAVVSRPRPPSTMPRAS